MKKSLDPLVLSLLVFLLMLGCLAHLMYGNCQTSKYHYTFQCYWMSENLPKWMIIHDFRETPDGSICDSYIRSPKNFTGIWTDWYRSKKIYGVFTFKNGQVKGGGKTWYENGNVKYIWIWKDGELVVASYLDENGHDMIED